MSSSAAALIFGLLTLGPIITINGHANDIPGPFVLFQQLPFLKGNRYTSRYIVMLQLSLSVLAAYALAQLKIKNSILGPKSLTFPLLIAALFLFEHLSAPLPHSDVRVPSPYQTIAADPTPATVLDSKETIPMNHRQTIFEFIRMLLNMPWTSGIALKAVAYNPIAYSL